MKFLMLISTSFYIIAGLLSRKVSGLKCWKCDNQGSSPKAQSCAAGIMKTEYAVLCNSEVTHCETQWLIPEGVTKWIGAKVTRDCRNDMDHQLNFTEGCLVTIPFPDMNMTTELCYCKGNLCNTEMTHGKKKSSAFGFSHPKSISWLTLLLQTVAFLTVSA